MESGSAKAIVTGGRDTDDDQVDIDLGDDEHISALHFSLEATAKYSRKKNTPPSITIRIRDEGSTNGTKINGIKIPSKKWFKVEQAEGEEYALIKVGKTHLVLPMHN